jgi:2,3-bisphosphoglycerate-dependent phosphoglycerate mutase
MLKYIKCFAIVLLLQFSFEATAQKTTVWIVRHAEKDTSFANRLNPDLTVVGMQRAKDLAAYLQKENIVKIFSTDTKRTKQTATYFNMPIEIYNPKNVTTVLDFINLDKQDKSILIVGHSNTVLETIEALGGARPVTQLSDDDYDYLFKVVLADGKPAQVHSFHFGQYHRGGNATMK